MKNVLILGAGLSSSSLIKYLIQHSEEMNTHVHVVDRSLKLIEKKTMKHPRSTAHAINALDKSAREPLLEQADLVISMLPARFHLGIAEDCLELGKNLITPSYLSKEIKAMDADVKEKGLIFLNEVGVDPGIDHMSAMQIIDRIREQGGVIDSFKSFCGGLVAPDYDNNLLHYKFTWNPRNVVLAGQGGASCFIQNGQYKFIPYHRLFKRTEEMDIPGFGTFEGYANRDSLKYRKIYGLDDIPTIYRGTLRRPGYSKFWSTLIDLGLTDDAYTMENSESLTPRSFINAFLPYNLTKAVETKLEEFLGSEKQEVLEIYRWLGFFENQPPLGIKDASPAMMLQQILEAKMQLDQEDKDMLVMYHAFVYRLDGEIRSTKSYMVNLGEDKTYTSMSNTVGYPVAICAKFILNGTITEKGAILPLSPGVYNPVLKELEELGIVFKEKEEVLPF
jgi:saccharopine dehydrogenase-like NADP-dependent oxidoreductase